jgi:hypothetical protein
VWLAYLLLRFNAARLGEFLSLDDRIDLDLTESVVFLGQGKAKQGEQGSAGAGTRKRGEGAGRLSG